MPPHEALRTPSATVSSASGHESLSHGIKSKATAILIGLLAIGSPLVNPASSERAVGPETDEEFAEGVDNTVITPEGKRNCTSIRIGANSIYGGWACEENGDSFVKIGGGGSDRGWVYGAVRIARKGKDVVKCGFVREGVLSTKPPRSRTITRCKYYYPKIRGSFEDGNCGDKRPDPCMDGTYFSRVTKSKNCTNTRTYRNFESDEPSPLNVLGTGQGGFSDPIEENKRTSVRYRVEYKWPTSEGIKGIVVRSPEWGWMASACVTKGENRRGGTLIKK